MLQILSRKRTRDRISGHAVRRQSTRIIDHYILILLLIKLIAFIFAIIVEVNEEPQNDETKQTIQTKCNLCAYK